MDGLLTVGIIPREVGATMDVADLAALLPVLQRTQITHLMTMRRTAIRARKARRNPLPNMGRAMRTTIL